MLSQEQRDNKNRVENITGGFPGIARRKRTHYQGAVALSGLPKVNTATAAAPNQDKPAGQSRGVR